MGFNRPGITPDFLAQGRHAEDNAWRARASTGISDKNNNYGNYNNSSNTLPLYKDKPYDGIRPRRSRGSRVVMAVAIAVGVFIVYSIGRRLNGHATLLFGTSLSSSISWSQRQQAVKRVFAESWADYADHAWGFDVYHPLTQTGQNMGPKPLGWIIVDSIDTAMIMGLDNEVKMAREWIKNVLDYDMDYEVNTFETTIRMLGGLLSAHYISQDDLYLDQAADLANRILNAFESPSGLPLSSVNLRTGAAVKSHDNGFVSTAEAATLQLELKYLSKLTGEDLYWKTAERVLQVMDNASTDKSGLVPIFINPVTGKFEGKNIRLGSRGDSYYEYLLKQYLQTNKKEHVYLEMYEEAIQGIQDHLVAKSLPNHLTFFGELPEGIGGRLSPKMDHLVCFMGGLLALGATDGQLLDTARRSAHWKASKEKDMTLARELTKTCYEMYAQTASGLAPEIAHFNTDPNKKKDFMIKPADAHNLQRPETVESLFVLWRITKDPIYRQWGWEIFEAFENHTKIVSGDSRAPGYTSLNNVDSVPVKQRDNMESFWMAETLKYLYLLFDDSEHEIFPLTDVVFNTEAHPLPVFNMDPLFVTGWARGEELPKLVTDKPAETKKTKVVVETIKVAPN